MTKTIHIPTINDNPFDFDTLFGLWNNVNGDRLSLRFDFSYCSFLRQNAVAFLGGLIRLVEYRGGTVEIDWDSLHGDVALNLAKNNFRHCFGDRTFTRTGNTIPYREDDEYESSGLMNYLKVLWLGRGWVHVSEKLRDAIVGTVLECYVNAFEHSGSNIGVFSCGQYYPNLNQLILTAVDFGVGIPSNVRSFLNRHGLGADLAIRWAFQSGTTTKPNGIGRGMGLDLLKKFIKINKGRMEVFSHEGYAVFGENREEYSRRSSFFEGTLINITLQCDEKYYLLASETSPEYYF